MMTPLVIKHRATLQLGHQPEAPAESWKPRIKSSPSCLLKEAFLALWFKITGTSFQEWFGELIFAPHRGEQRGPQERGLQPSCGGFWKVSCGACHPDLLILYAPPDPHHPQSKIAISTLNTRLQAGVEDTPPSRCGSQAMHAKEGTQKADVVQVDEHRGWGHHRAGNGQSVEGCLGGLGEGKVGDTVDQLGVSFQGDELFWRQTVGKLQIMTILKAPG